MIRKDIQKIVEEKIVEWRKRSSQIIGPNDVYQPPKPYMPRQHKRKYSDDIVRIKDKYAKDKTEIKQSVPNVLSHPTKPVRRKKNGGNLYASKSESDLLDATIKLDNSKFKETEFKNSLHTINEVNYEYQVTLDALDQRSILQTKSNENLYVGQGKRFSIDSTTLNYLKKGKSQSNGVIYNTQTSSPNTEKSTFTLFAKRKLSLGQLFRKSPKNNLRRGYSEPYLDEISYDDSSVSDGKSPKKKWRFPFGKINFIQKIRDKSKSRTNLTEISPSSMTHLKNRQTQRIQDADNHFFESFGSVLRQLSAQQAEEESAPLAPFPDDEDEREEPECLARNAVLYEATPDDDSGIETPHETDSETEESDKLLMFGESVAMNIDELYSEILYEILHNVGGGDITAEVGQQAMLNYVQEAFKMTVEKHTQLLEDASHKEPPEIMLNVEVIEAKQLMPKDPNGMSDPFVALYLASNSSRRYNSSVKSATLNPLWEEYFSLPISENVQEDTLYLEVWDFDPAETVKEKMSKMFEVKGVKGLRKLMKEIAVTATTGKHENELIGRASVPLKTIPATGLSMWYSLDKKNKLQHRGVINVRLSFSAQKNAQVSAQEHRHLLRILLLHELEISKVAPYWWSGTFSSAAEAVLIQHVAQSGLTPTDNLLSQWSVYCNVTLQHPLSLSLFVSLLEKLNKPLKSGNLSKEDTRIFWDATKKLLPVCYNFIRKLRKKKCTSDRETIKTLKETLTILNKISLLDQPGDVEIFPPTLYVWVKEDKLTLTSVLVAAIKNGAEDFFAHTLQGQENNGTNEEDARLLNLIRIVKMVRCDLQKAVEYYDRIFIDLMNVPYTRTLYGIYEKRLAEIIEPEVTEVCKTLKRLDYDEGSDSTIMLAGGLNGSSRLGAPVVEGEPMTMGTKLFELYLALRRFLTLGQGLNENGWRDYSISNFYHWFSNGVAQWLDIAAYKALTRIERAIELDNLTPITSLVKHSSSPVDTLGIFNEIKIFWQQLDWPDIEESYTFIAKIIDDICRCCVYYSDKMSAVVSSLAPERSAFGQDKFQVTTEWCTAVNNMDYVCASLTPFVQALGLDTVVSSMCDAKSPMEAQRCKETLQNVMANAIDTVRNKLVELLEILVKKMMPWITRFLLEGAEVYNTDCASMERVMLYLEDNLQTLDSNMSADNFSRVLQLLWEQLADLLYELIQSNIEKRRPPSFFANLHECVNLMIRSFQQDSNEKSTCNKLNKVLHLLRLYGMETQDLIHQYHLERWREQHNSDAEPKMGLLTIRAQFTDNALHLEIMNARNLTPCDSNGLCDSYVRVALLPEETFTTVLKPKTQTHNKNLFPLYDEIFQIPLTTSQRRVKDGLLQLTVKDKDLFSMSNQFLGEAYVHFDEIPSSADSRLSTLSSLPQVHLALTRPEGMEGEAIKALETRMGDKMAREFIKKQRAKLPQLNNKSFGFSLS